MKIDDIVVLNLEKIAYRSVKNTFNKTDFTKVAMSLKMSCPNLLPDSQVNLWLNQFLSHKPDKAELIFQLPAVWVTPSIIPVRSRREVVISYVPRESRPYLSFSRPFQDHEHRRKINRVPIFFSWNKWEKCPNLWRIHPFFGGEKLSNPTQPPVDDQGMAIPRSSEDQPVEDFRVGNNWKGPEKNTWVIWVIYGWSRHFLYNNGYIYIYIYIYIRIIDYHYMMIQNLYTSHVWIIPDGAPELAKLRLNGVIQQHSHHWGHHLIGCRVKGIFKGISWNSATSRWMFHDGKSSQSGWFGKNPHFQMRTTSSSWWCLP